jgi:hypothetical protein
MGGNAVIDLNSLPADACSKSRIFDLDSSLPSSR